VASSRALPRGRHRLSREAVAESQRERILNAIVELVATHGYAGTTVGGIAAEAGVSRTTFYEQFESKEDCFRAAYDAVAGQIVEAIAERAAGIEDKREQLRAGIQAYFDYGAERPAAAATFIVEVHRAGPEALEQRFQVLKRFCEVLDQNAPDTPPAASMAAIVAIDAMAHDLIRRGKASDLPKLSDDAQYVVEKLLG
jgi:AcrR family transcriptional regulator